MRAGERRERDLGGQRDKAERAAERTKAKDTSLSSTELMSHFTTPLLELKTKLSLALGRGREEEIPWERGRINYTLNYSNLK